MYKQMEYDKKIYTQRIRIKLGGKKCLKKLKGNFENILKYVDK